MLTQSTRPYPTPDDIMKNPVDFREDTIKAVLEWKKEIFLNWKNFTMNEKLIGLEGLVMKLSEVYGINVSVDRDYDKYSFIPSTSTITFDSKHASIISTLHEFRHALNGADEFSACRWSIHLFKTCFPKQFDLLEFQPGSHLLRKKST